MGKCPVCWEVNYPICHRTESDGQDRASWFQSTGPEARTLGYDNIHVKVQPGWLDHSTINILDKILFIDKVWHNRLSQRWYHHYIGHSWGVTSRSQRWKTTEIKIHTFLFVCLFVFGDRVSLCSPGCPGTHSVDQAGLELRNWPASASQVLGLQACTTTAWLEFLI